MCLVGFPPSLVELFHVVKETWCFREVNCVVSRSGAHLIMQLQKAWFLPHFCLWGKSIYWPNSEKPTQEWPWAEIILQGGWRLPGLLSTTRHVPAPRWGPTRVTEPGPSFPAWKQNPDRHFIEQNIHSTWSKRLCSGKRYPHPYAHTNAQAYF